jgi:spermidine synthase
MHLSRALEIDPGLADAHNNLAKLLALDGRTKEAIDHLNRALEIRPVYPDAQYNLARTLRSTGRASEATEYYRKALALRPDWPPVLSEAAWLLATHPDPSVRNPIQAVSFAERAVGMTNRRDPVALDVLAAAYAAAGRFDMAVATGRAAQELLAKGNSDAAAVIAGRISMYQKRQAFIDLQDAGPVR